MNIPLVSEYKIPFIRHRIIQTFLGGFELTLFGEPIQWFPYALFKLVIFVLPSLIGITFACLVDDQLLHPYIGVLASSITGFLLTLSVCLLCSIHDTPNKTTPLVNLADKVTTKSSRLNRLLPKVNRHSSSGYRVMQAILFAVLLGMSVHLYRLKVLHSRMPFSFSLSICVFLLAWLTHTIAQHSLVVGPLPETAAYSMTFNRCDCLNRPGHLLILYSIQLSFLTTPSVYNVCTVLICCLPVLWLLGLIPPLSALIHYFLEQINILLLGGTASSSMISLFIMVTFSLSSINLCQIYITDRELHLMSLSLIAFIVSNKWLRNTSHTRKYTSILYRLFTILATVGLHRGPISQNIDSQVTISVIALQIILIFVKHSQSIYLFDFIRNPLVGVQDLHGISNRIFLLMNTFVRILLHIALPFLLMSMFKIRLSSDANSLLGIGKVSFETVAKNILTFRLYRQSWQDPYWIGMQTVALTVIDMWMNISWWTRLEIEQKYILIDIICVTTTNFLKKFYLVLVILFTSVFLPKQRLSYSWLIFIINFLIFPVNLVLIMISSILKAPLLPLFTLPIFMLSFPRPSKFWSNTPMTMVSNANDAVYYQQVLPHLIESIHARKLFWDFCKAGDFYLARFDDRLIWMQVLERGHNYIVMQMKGLELQETSCHAIEASAIDHIIESTLDNEGNYGLLARWFNTNLVYTITPIISVPVTTYSDARSVLTGIIDSPETYTRIRYLYCQVFIWVILSRRILINQKNILNKTQIGKLNQSNGVKTYINIEPLPNSKNLTYNQLQPDNLWSNGCYQYSQRRAMMIIDFYIFSSEWFDLILNVLTESQCQLSSTERQSLSITYRHITNVCFSILFPSTFNDMPSAQSIYELFNGIINNEQAENEFFKNNQDLYQVCIKSFQYASKIAFDQIIFSNETLTFEELINVLQNFDSYWHFGNRITPEWKQAVINETKYLFTVGKETVKEIYTSRLLTLQELPVHVCKLNRPMIESIWATLSLELFYLTNDDEERYSIQAHPIILRNLTVQAADSPLGYPIFASSPQIINCLT